MIAHRLIADGELPERGQRMPLEATDQATSATGSKAVVAVILHSCLLFSNEQTFAR